MSYFPPTGSTVAFQTDATKLAANVSVTGGFVNVLGSIAAAPFPGSVSGVGLFNVNHTGNGSVLAVVPGSVKTAPFPHSVSGVGTFNINPVGNGSVIATLVTSSVATLQGTNPWIVQLTSGSVITTGGNSSVQVVGEMPPQSVSGVGLFNVNHVGNGSIITTQTFSNNTSTIARLTNSSVAVLQGTNPWVVGNSSVQVVGAIPPASVSGVGLFNVNHTGNGSIIALSTGSVAATFLASSLISGHASTVHASSGSVLVLASVQATLYAYITDFLVSNTGASTTLVTFTDSDGSVMGKTIAPTGGGAVAAGITSPMRTLSPGKAVYVGAATATSVLHAWVGGYKGL